jgi:tRNA (mo5U34)-methyltransferase
MKIRSMLKSLRGEAPGEGREEAGELVPFSGYAENRYETPYVDPLSDEDLAELNRLLKWRCFTADANGRRFGDAAWAGKRCEPQTIPDPKIVLMHERFDLSDKHVLEVGCFEGVHTIGLSMFARRVTAIDARMENVVKTIVRCALFGHHPTVFKFDVEATDADHAPLSADLAHHVGVLYHLKDPVRHLLDLGRFISRGLMLDTHYAEDSEAVETYEAAGRRVVYKKYFEGGQADPFSGMYDHAKWLRLEDMVALLREAGFREVEIVEKRAERNGPRVLLFADKG